MSQNTITSLLPKSAVVILTITCCFLCVKECIAVREYAAIRIYDVGESKERPYGVLAGKPGEALYGITLTGQLASQFGEPGNPDHLYKISPDNTITCVVVTDLKKPRMGDFPRVFHNYGPFHSLSRSSSGIFYGAATWLGINGLRPAPSGDQLYTDSIIQLTPPGKPQIIYTFPEDDIVDGPLLPADDGNLYGVAIERTGQFPDDRKNFFAFMISPGGSGYHVLAKVDDPKNSKDASALLGSLTQNQDRPIFAPSPVQGADGNVYVYVHAADYSLSQPQTIIRVTSAGEVTTLADVPTLYSLGAGHDGNLYARTRRSIIKIDMDGRKTKVHDFTAAEGVPRDISGLQKGPDGALYESCFGPDGTRTIFSITTTGKYKVMGRVNTPLADQVFYALTPAANGVFYEVADLSIDKLVPAGKHFSLNFVGSGGAKTPGTVDTEDTEEEAGVSPTPAWVNVSGTDGAKVVSDEFEEAGPTITWSCEHTGQEMVAGDTPDSHMMQGYLETKGKKDITVQVWGMPTDYVETGYDVYVYCSGGKGALSSHGKYTIGKTVAVTGTNKEDFDGTYTLVDKDGGNYVLFPKLTDRSFTLTVTTDEDKAKIGHAVVNGIQIVQHVNSSTPNVARTTPKVKPSTEPVEVTPTPKDAPRK